MDSLRQECGVFSPCGRYFVKFLFREDTLVQLRIYTKQSHNFATIAAATQSTSSSSLSVACDYEALLDPVQVEEITTNAGVRKDFEPFAKMIYSALVGSNTAVSFFIENCAEMEKRIRELRVGGGSGLTHNTSYGSTATQGTTKSDDEESDEESDDARREMRRRFFDEQLFFSLDYNVDFTRALFPIPLHSAAINAHNSRNKSGTQQGTVVGGSNAHGNKRNGGSRSQQQGEGEEEESAYRRKFIDAAKENKKYEQEVKRLKKENEALTKLCNERMSEMQRLCDDLQSKIGSEAETRKLKRELVEAQHRVKQLESLNDSLRREVKAASMNQRSNVSPLRRPSSVSPNRAQAGPSTQPQSMRQQRRFDTPPHSNHHPQQQRTTPRDRTSNSRSTTPPRSPRPAWGQRVPPPTNRSLHSSYANDSLNSSAERKYKYGRFDSPKKQQRNSPSAVPISSGSAAHQRLYMMDTAASSGQRSKFDRDRLLLS